MIRALIVDDEKMTRNGLVRHIKWEQLGVDEVQTAASSNEALQMLIHFTPHLVISDIRMPGMNGVELCQENSPAPASLPNYFFDRVLR